MTDAFRGKLESEKLCFVDCHAHISAKDFSEDIDVVIEEARKVGVRAIVGVTEFKAEFAGMLNLHDRYPDVIAPCVGVHPIQSLCPDRSATLEVCETALKSEIFSLDYVLIHAQMNISLF